MFQPLKILIYWDNVRRLKRRDRVLLTQSVYFDFAWVVARDPIYLHVLIYDTSSCVGHR